MVFEITTSLDYRWVVRVSAYVGRDVVGSIARMGRWTTSVGRPRDMVPGGGSDPSFVSFPCFITRGALSDNTGTLVYLARVEGVRGREVPFVDAAHDLVVYYVFTIMRAGT